MDAYKVLLKSSAAREIEGLSTKEERQRIVRRIQGLAANPRPHGSEKLAGQVDRFRVRQGRYRIVYSIDDGAATVTVFRVAHRKEVYRKTT
ncbi:MAG: type II toxin-antitoxin system RelE/ParE family toxin [Thermoanaerobaculia bacterium]